MTASLLDRIEAARAAADPDLLLGAIPYAKWMGLSCAIDGDELITTMKFGPHLVGNPTIPALHGGTLGALLESTAVMAVLWAAETVLLPKTITFTVDYLRSAAAVDTFARGVVTKHGRRVATVHAEAWQVDRAQPVATANAHFLVKREA